MKHLLRTMRKGVLDLQLFSQLSKSKILHFHLIKHVILSSIDTFSIKKMNWCKHFGGANFINVFKPFLGLSLPQRFLNNDGRESCPPFYILTAYYLYRVFPSVVTPILTALSPPVKPRHVLPVVDLMESPL